MNGSECIKFITIIIMLTGVYVRRNKDRERRGSTCRSEEMRMSY